MELVGAHMHRSGLLGVRSVFEVNEQPARGRRRRSRQIVVLLQAPQRPVLSVRWDKGAVAGALDLREAGCRSIEHPDRREVGSTICSLIIQDKADVVGFLGGGAAPSPWSSWPGLRLGGSSRDAAKAIQTD
jgi:hypothetical protein